MTAIGEIDGKNESSDGGSYNAETSRWPTTFKCAPHLDDFMTSKMAELPQPNAVVHFIFDVSREDRNVWPHIRESVLVVRANGSLIKARKIRQSYMDSPRPAIDMVLDVIKKVYSIEPTFREILTVYSDVPRTNGILS